MLLEETENMSGPKDFPSSNAEDVPADEAETSLPPMIEACRQATRLS
jgi:hypothetical protein